MSIWNTWSRTTKDSLRHLRCTGQVTRFGQHFNPMLTVPTEIQTHTAPQMEATLKKRHCTSVLYDKKGVHKISAKISCRVSEDPTQRHNEDTTFRLFGQEVLQRAGARRASRHYSSSFLSFQCILLCVYFFVCLNCLKISCKCWG